MNLGVVILAAGQGTRMKSALPKVLHKLAGRPLLGHVITTAKALQPDRVAVVYGHGGEMVPAQIDDSTLGWVEQAQQLGTGHAVEQALPQLQGSDRTLILYGDVPLTSQTTLQQLIERSEHSPLALLTITLDDPRGYGRIVRNSAGQIDRIVEQKDATDAERAIKEVNTGIMVVATDRLNGWIERLENSNAQGEFYLTDIVAMAVAEGVEVASGQPADLHEVMGVNDRVQLAELERYHRRAEAERLMRQGVTLRDPERFDLRGTLTAGEDVEIDANVIIEGDVILGDRVRIGANSVLRHVRVGNDVEIKENCVIEDAVIGQESIIGPYSRLRPQTELAARVHVGNFVEIKKSIVDEGSKLNHLSYVGDSIIGKRVNVGAGTITCNYDGANKFQTVIEDDAFIGSDTQLVAPVKVGRGGTIGAGSTITEDTPEETLTISRVHQKSISGWQRPVKQPKEQ